MIGTADPHSARLASKRRPSDSDRHALHRLPVREGVRDRTPPTPTQHRFEGRLDGSLLVPSTHNEKGPGAEDTGADRSPRKMTMNNTATVSQPTLQEQLEGGAKSHRNQAQVAHEFAVDHRGRFLFVRNKGWMAFNGQRWVDDTGLTQDALLKTLLRLREQGTEMMASGRFDHDEILERQGKNLLTLVKACESASGLAGVLKIASNLQGMTATIDQLDADGHVLNMPNGTLDLNTMQVRPHDPEDLITRITRGSFDPTHPRQSSVWDGFLNQVLPDADVQGFFQRINGLALIGEVIENIFTIATGTGRNGKGVAYGAVMHSLGDYAAVAEDGLFEVQRGGNSQSASPGLAKLRGVRLLVASELEEKARISAAFMKRMTGGDRITARELYGSPFEFSPAFLILMITNYLPKLPANDPATWARVRVVPFRVVVPKDQQDPYLGSKLKDDADAVLAWAVEGLADYLANGLDEPASVLAATQDYAESQDDVRRFVEARCTDTSSGGDTTTILHYAFLDWADKEGIHGVHVLGRTKFGEALDRLGVTATRTNKGAVRTGLIVDQSAA
ncbi:phage/plasmid primase, P4 family [Curtobacterium sp. MCLR17_007]|uniref:DNA primase family protein n=1 Tax=Curtobacterium sp. MCLR17_007 TaxID=2175648 RepID=UPI0011B64EA7|nr:DNA primase family protein [Curtobacterium sp. MCLR17_007]WIB60435.1 phage/plasmid primase, P4 family [Curtobacterium sp. MCLR17_007]